jgi:putative membrane protein
MAPPHNFLVVSRAGRCSNSDNIFSYLFINRKGDIMRMTPLLQALVLTAASAALGAHAATTLSKGDQAIVVGMAQANMAEVAAGKIALEKSANADVKKFAQTMIDDHGKALDSVTEVAKAKQVTLPAEPDAAHKAMAAQLQKLSGDAFDKAYMKQAGVADHSKVHAKLMKDEKAAKDPDVKALAAKMLPTVASHLDMAKAAPLAK